MKVLLAVAVAAAVGSGAWGQAGGAGSAQVSSSAQAQAQAGGERASLATGTTVDAELSKSVDARKAKPGDEVTAKVRNDVREEGKVLLHRGTRLIGHVTQAQARTGGEAASQLGIIFDRAELKGGQAMELHAAIQALAPPQSAGANDTGMGDVGTSPTSRRDGGDMAAETGVGGVGGGMAGGVAGAAGGAVRGAGNAVSDVGRGAGRAAGGLAGNLSASSHGAMGMPGLEISNELSNSTNGTVLVSKNKDIRLDSGTRMMLRVVGSSEAAH